MRRFLLSYLAILPFVCILLVSFMQVSYAVGKEKPSIEFVEKNHKRIGKLVLTKEQEKVTLQKSTYYYHTYGIVVISNTGEYPIHYKFRRWIDTCFWWFAWPTQLSGKIAPGAIKIFYDVRMDDGYRMTLSSYKHFYGGKGAEGTAVVYSKNLTKKAKEVSLL